MPIARDPVGGLVHHPAGQAGDPVLDALRRGEEIPDRRANLLRLAWDRTLPYEEAERLLPEDELDDLCDLLDDLRSYGTVHCVYELKQAQRTGWILSDEDRAWYRRECGLPDERPWTDADASILELWRKGVRIEQEAEHVARWVLDARIEYEELQSRLPTAALQRVFALLEPGSVEVLDSGLEDTGRQTT